jgi:ribonuclease-3
MFLAKLFGFFSKDSFKKRQERKLRKLEKKLNIKIHNSELFLKALTHSSFVDEERGLTESNERLEFLGDAVLGLVVAEFLFNKFPEEEEGFLTKIRSRLVYKDALAEAAKSIDLESYVLFNKKFVGNSKEGRKTIIADAMEALIGAIYLDSGLYVAKQFIYERIVKPNFESGKFKEDKNYKGRLLEFTHAKKLGTPRYETVREDGPEHDKTFTVEVLINDFPFGMGTGKSKKSAEQEAAKEALKKLEGGEAGT